MRLAYLLLSLSLLAPCVSCKRDDSTVPPGPKVKKPGAPPEDMSADEWETRREATNARAAAEANKPKPKKVVQWPAAIDAELAIYDGRSITLKSPVDFLDPDQMLTEEARLVLDDVAFILKQRPRITKVELSAHRDSEMETLGKNVTQLRANTAKAALVEMGIDASRLEAHGYGDQMPIDSNLTAAGRRRNNRLEVVIQEIDGSPILAGE